MSFLWQSAERIIETTAQQPVTVRIRTFNFPGWKAYVDGVPTEIMTEGLTGSILINVPKETIESSQSLKIHR